MIMKKVSILVSTIDSGGAEKQAVLLAIQLSKHTDVNLIVLNGGHTEYKGNVDLLAESSVKVHRLNGSMLLKTIRIRELLKESHTDVLLNYLTMPDFLGSFLGKRLKISVYNGIRNSRLPRSKMLIEKWLIIIGLQRPFTTVILGLIILRSSVFGKTRILSFLIASRILPNQL